MKKPTIIASGQPASNPRPAHEAKNPFTPLNTTNSWQSLRITDTAKSVDFVELFTLGTEFEPNSTTPHTYLYELEFPSPHTGDPNHHYYWKRIDPPLSGNLDGATVIAVQQGGATTLKQTKTTRTISPPGVLPRTIFVGSGHGFHASAHTAASGTVPHAFYLSDHGDSLVFWDE